jgi:hypothetical protein
MLARALLNWENCLVLLCEDETSKMVTLVVREQQRNKRMSIVKGGSFTSSESSRSCEHEEKRPLKKISVHPSGQYNERQRLFQVLEQAFPVRFVAGGSESGWEPDGYLLLKEDQHLTQQVGTLGVPVFVVATHGERVTETKVVSFSAANSLDNRLRGVSLSEEYATGIHGIPSLPGDEILASMGTVPVWIHRKVGGSRVDVVSVCPEDLSENEILKHHLQGTRFLSLLPLYHFLKRVTADINWTLPPLRANIHFDDPNLHWRSYGQIDYPLLAAHAEQHNYHASMATIPLDLWYAHPRAVEAFQRNPHRLSLLIHGNNHTSNEFGEAHHETPLRFLLAQALARASRFESKYSIPVSRVMAFPQEACRMEVIPALADAGFEGITSTRFLPWNNGFRLTRMPVEERLACCWPAGMVHGALPVLRRLYLRHANSNPWVKGEMVIGAYLGQPMILYGHHFDLDSGLGLMEEWSHHLNSRFEVEWTSLERIARGNYMTRLHEDTLHVRLFTRLAVIRVPEGIQRVVVECGSGQYAQGNPVLEWVNGTCPMDPGVQVEIPVKNNGQACTLETRILTPSPNSMRNKSPRLPILWPYVRRAITEVEDRLRPALVKARLL